jgi:uncharacterized membrane protein
LADVVGVLELHGRRALVVLFGPDRPVADVVARLAEVTVNAGAALGAFEAFERRFAQQVRISILLTGISGIYMMWRLAAWERFKSPSFWWLDLMVAFWVLFALMLFVIEPLWADRLLRFYVLRDKNRAFSVMTKLHWLALAAATLTIAAGTLGAHGYLPY